MCLISRASIASRANGTIPACGRMRTSISAASVWARSEPDRPGFRPHLSLPSRRKHLTVFQRTANYSIPARNGPVTADDIKHTRDNYDEIWRLARAGTNGHPFTISTRSALSVSDAERQEIYEKAWERGGLRFRASFSDVLQNVEANLTASDFLRDKIKTVVKNPAVAEMLTPRDHGSATKRPPIDSGISTTFNRDNVLLVDLKAEPIVEVTANGIRTTKQDYALDIIVFATGFERTDWDHSSI